MYVISQTNISCPVDCYVSEKWTWGPAGLDCTFDPCNFFSYDHRRDHCQSLFKEVKMLNLTRYNNKTIMISCSHTGRPSMKSSTLKGFSPLSPPPQLKKKTKMDWVIELPSVALDLSSYQDFQEMDLRTLNQTNTVRIVLRNWEFLKWGFYYI